MTENNDFNNTENDSTNSRNEKRFTLVEDDYSAWSIYDNAEFPRKSLEAKEIVDLLNENEQLNQFKNLARDYNIPFDKLCDAFEEGLNQDTVTDLETEILKLKEENKQLKQDELYETLTERGNKLIEENNKLHEENKRMTDKLNSLALELLNYDMISIGKATEISEMSYFEFLKYRKENGNLMNWRIFE